MFFWYTATMKTNVYIDAFNLYYGALRYSPHKWLNLGALSTVLFPNDQINRIKYYTARLKRDATNPEKSKRQQIYLRALRTIPQLEIVYGYFQSHPVKRMLATSSIENPEIVTVIKNEEKGSDVNLAVDLIADGCAGRYEQAVVISNDSDLGRAVKIVAKMYELPVVVVNPFYRNNKPPAKALVKHASAKRTLRARALKRCQFPETIQSKGKKIIKPSAW